MTALARRPRRGREQSGGADSPSLAAAGVADGLDISRDVLDGPCVAIGGGIAELVGGCGGLLAAKAARGQRVWVVLPVTSDAGPVGNCLGVLGLPARMPTSPREFASSISSDDAKVGPLEWEGPVRAALVEGIVRRRPAQVLVPIAVAAGWDLAAQLARLVPAAVVYGYEVVAWPWAGGVLDPRQGGGGCAGEVEGAGWLARLDRAARALSRGSGPRQARGEAGGRVTLGSVDVTPWLAAKVDAHNEAVRHRFADGPELSLTAALGAPTARVELLSRR